MFLKPSTFDILGHILVIFGVRGLAVSMVSITWMPVEQPWGDNSKCPQMLSNIFGGKYYPGLKTTELIKPF